jgi:hypothetical protein
MLAKRTTIAVTLKALMARINRRLGPEGKVLKAARSARIAQSVGRYFIVKGNTIVAQRVGPEALGRELGVLLEWEHLDKDAPT